MPPAMTGSPAPMPTGADPTLSAIIPTLDAAASLGATLAALARFPGIEIVVADGGSRDATAAIARDAGARVVGGTRGRGPQLRAGAAAASGSWLLFLHADTVPVPGWERVVGAYIESAANCERAGYFRFALDDGRRAARRLERLVAWRCRLLALPYGDQGLLISRALYESLGGFAPLALMEDVDLVRRLGRRRLVALDHAAVTSAARYRGGYARRSARNLLCLLLHACGVPVRLIARLYA